VGARLGSGILFLLDRRLGEKDDTVTPLRPPSAPGAEGEDGPDAAPPFPFEWVVGNYY